MVDTLSSIQELTEFQYRIGHDMFAPEGRIVTPQDLGSFILATYGQASIERNEDLDAMLIGDAFRYLPLSEDVLVDTAEQFGVGSLAMQALEEVNRDTDLQIAQAIDRVRHLPVDNHLLAANDVLTQDALAGEFRRSGRPYYTHVFRVAAMGYDIAKALEAEGIRYDPPRTVAEIILREQHDSPEETMPAGKHYHPDREGHFSPLLILRLMEKFDNPYARETADALSYITHLKVEGMSWMRTYTNYIHQKVMRSLMAVQAKDDDIFDNRRNEPKPVATPLQRERRAQKYADYDALEPALKQRAVELAPSPADVAWIEQSNELRQQMKPSLQTPKVRALSRFIYSD